MYYDKGTWGELEQLRLLVVAVMGREQVLCQWFWWGDSR